MPLTAEQQIEQTIPAPINELLPEVVLQTIRCDAQVASERYLEETRVPFGGE